MFLETATLTAEEFAMDSGAIAALFALGAIFVLFFFLLMIGVYIFTSFAYMAIARKAKYSSPGIAWIPGIGPLIITYKVSGMHWWPFLLFIGFIIPFVNFIAMILFTVFSIIWLWKTFEVIGKPGWWAILTLVPILNFIILGIAAWSKD